MADQSIAMVLLRLVIAVVVVVGLLLLTAKLTRKIGIKTDGTSGPAIRLVSRQPLSRNTSIAVVRAGDRTLVLGVTDHAITLLSDQDSVEFVETESPARSQRGKRGNTVDPGTNDAGLRYEYPDSETPGFSRTSGASARPSSESTPGFMGKLRERTVRKK